MNDHTFLVPENLRCFLDGLSVAHQSGGAGAPDPRAESIWLGHRLKENGPGGAAFVSGAAGYVLSRKLLGRLLVGLSQGGKCGGGTKRERSQPGLLLAKCLRNVLGAVPTELDDTLSAHAPRVHVYGPARLVSGQASRPGRPSLS